jgi:hypothetical protein
MISMNSRHTMNTHHTSDSSVRLMTTLQARRPKNQILILDRIKKYFVSSETSAPDVRPTKSRKKCVSGLIPLG